MFKTLYLCYFGLREPLVQTQVLPYLRELIKAANLEIHLVTFEPDFAKKWTGDQVEEEKKKLQAEGITWHALGYHKWPSVPATFYDIFRGAFFVWKLNRRVKLDLVHARIHVPMLMAVLARKFSGKFNGKKFRILFDIRGFFPEEYTDAGVWTQNGWLYKSVKRVERWLFKESDGFVVLTEAAREVLFPESRETGFDKNARPVRVIPCCVDFAKRFQQDISSTRDEIRDEMKTEGRLVITHLGALGGLYLTDDIADFLAAARERYPDVFAMFLTQTSPDLIIPRLKSRGFTEDDFFVGKVSPTEVPRYLSGADIALSFVKASYATISRSPTKIPEYLACGLPVISNKGVGDTDQLIAGEKTGVLIEDFSKTSYLKALEQVAELKNDPGFSDNCRKTAFAGFDVANIGGERYRSIYRTLLESAAKDAH